jgi:hypothetical protein
MLTYDGEGFLLQYPINAQVENVTIDSAAVSEVRIVGPEVFVKPGNANWGYQGAAYEIIVRTYSNPENLDAESWARDYILTSWQEATEQGEPLMEPPVSESGAIIEQRVGESFVAGYPAFRVDFLAGDSYRRVFFLSYDYQVITLSFYDYPLSNQPLAMVQQDVYALIMSTFRFERE